MVVIVTRKTSRNMTDALSLKTCHLRSTAGAKLPRYMTFMYLTPRGPYGQLTVLNSLRVVTPKRP